MGIKKYIVREGFNFRVRVETDKGIVEKVFSEGDTLQLDQEIGDAAHQLEYADEKDRTAAAKAEAEAAAKAAPAVTSGGVDQDALAAAISTGIAQAFAQMQAAQKV
jgi:hypothetical protein